MTNCLDPPELQWGETQPHQPAQTTRFPQLPNLLDWGFAFSLVLIISPQVPVLIKRVRPPHKTWTRRKPQHCFNRSWMTARGREGLGAGSIRWLLYTPAAIPVRSWLLLTSQRLDLVGAQYHFKTLCIIFGNELRIHRADFSLKKTLCCAVRLHLVTLLLMRWGQIHLVWSCS